jgi:hypothetical protein
MDTPKVKLSDQPWQQCDCGGTIFVEKMMFKRVSGLRTGQREDQHVPVPVFVCCACNKVPSFIYKSIPGMPEENQAKSKFNIEGTGTA